MSGWQSRARAMVACPRRSMRGPKATSAGFVETGQGAAEVEQASARPQGELLVQPDTVAVDRLGPTTGVVSRGIEMRGEHLPGDVRIVPEGRLMRCEARWPRRQSSELFELPAGAAP